jgi:hypothetical protein
MFSIVTSGAEYPIIEVGMLCWQYDFQSTWKCEGRMRENMKCSSLREVKWFGSDCSSNTEPSV